MNNCNFNILLVIFAVIVLIAIIYYLNNNNEQPIPNNGSISNIDTNKLGNKLNNIKNISANKNLNAYNVDNISDSIVDELVPTYNKKNKPNNNNCNTITPSNQISSEYGPIGIPADLKSSSRFQTAGPFNGYETKKYINMKKMEHPYDNNNNDNNNNDNDHDDFTYKKKRFTKRTPNDINDLFDVDQMLPKEIEEDWFDIEPLQSTKKIRGTHLIHPKYHMGNNTVGSSLKNGTHDIRGDIPNPKVYVSPWNNSTIEPDTNIKGLC